MLYTIQTISDSGSFAQPWGDDIKHCSSLADIRWHLDNWADQHSQVGSEESDAAVRVWKGRYDNVTDLYPDFDCRLGPRGGMIRESL
jgi:hypothetical protein